MSPEAAAEMLLRLTEGHQELRREVSVAIGLARRHDERMAEQDMRMARLEAAWMRWLQEQTEVVRRREAEMQNAVRWLASEVRGLAARVDRLEATAQPQPRRRQRQPRQDKATNGGEFDGTSKAIAGRADKAASTGHRPDVAVPSGAVEEAFELGRLVGRDEAGGPAS